jgi:hypothetical protein
MQEPHIEGVATHNDPESCVDVREDAGEALTGARTGAVLSREVNCSGVPTQLRNAEGNTGRVVTARRAPTLRGRRPAARAEPFCARTGRSLDRPWQMVPRAASGRPEAMSR